MRLNNFIELKRNLNDKDQLLKADVIIRYFVYAKYSYEIYKEYLKKWVETSEVGTDYKFEAAILAMYANGKICLDVTREINDEIEDDELNTLRQEKRKWAEHFADFRNDVSSHPINKDAKYFCYIASSGNICPNMTVHLLEIDTLKSLKKYEIYPKQDLDHLCEYLENLAKIYEKKWAKILRHSVQQRL